MAGGDELMTPAGQAPQDDPGPGRIARLLGRRGGSGRPLWLALVAALVVAMAGLLIMRQQATRTEQASDPGAASGLVMPQQGQATPLAAVGPLRGLDQPCTAWVVATGPAADAMAGLARPGGATGQQTSPTSPAAPTDQSSSAVQPGSWAAAMPDSPAFAVTTGRCVGIKDANSVVVGRQLAGVTLGVNAFASLASSVASPITWVPVTEVAWASARWLDLAVLQLGVSYSELAAAGVLPINAAAPAFPGDQVLAAGVPIAGIEPAQQYLRVTRCAAGSQVGVLEAGMLWSPSQSSDCDGFREGSAGSVLFNPAGQAVGMLNTSTINAPQIQPGAADCGAGRACEVTEQDVRHQAGRSYLQPVADLVPCLESGSLVLGDRCALPDPAGVVPAAANPPQGRPGSTVEVTLGAVPPGVRAVAHAAGSITVTDCFSRTGWSRPQRVRDWSLSLELPNSPGWVLACVGSPQEPTPVVVEVDATAPDTAGVQLRISEVPGGREVAPVLDPPQYWAFLWASGPIGTDCTAVEGYTQFRDEPAVIQADDLPATVCLIAVDRAGNRSTPVAREVR